MVVEVLVVTLLSCCAEALGIFLRSGWLYHYR